LRQLEIELLDDLLVQVGDRAAVAGEENREALVQHGVHPVRGPSQP